MLSTRVYNGLLKTDLLQCSRLGVQGEEGVLNARDLLQCSRLGVQSEEGVLNARDHFQSSIMQGKRNHCRNPYRWT